MAANTTPIFPSTPHISWATSALTTANTAYDGTGIVTTLFTAGTNGSRLDYLKIRSRGTNVATVVRVFINNGSATSTAANNSLFMERTILASTSSTVTETSDIYIPMDVSLPPGYTVIALLGTTVAAGYSVTAVGGDY